MGRIVLARKDLAYGERLNKELLVEVAWPLQSMPKGAFASVGDSVPEEAGIVVPQTVKGVAEGLQAFLDGKVQAQALDVPAYNAEAMRQFDAAIHHRPGA